MQSRVIILTLAVLLVSPAAAAGWGVKGDVEPNSGRDVSDGYMFLSPASSTADSTKVYFNGWFSNGFVANPNTNPNVGQLGTGVMPTLFKAWAVLGTWVDCNRDGYIGNGDPGLHEYPAVAPGVDQSLCPVTTPPNPIPAYGWVPVRNDGTWIHEFFPLGWEEWATMWNDTDPNAAKITVKEEDDNPWDLNDTDARVWVDLHLPETKLTGGSNCYINPQPRGTLQSTGGLVESADCFNGFRGTDTLTTVGNAGGDGTAVGQISFKDKPRDQSNSTSQLNRPNPYGQTSDPAYADHWDCSQPQTEVVVTRPDTGARVFATNISQPKTFTPNAGGSPSGQINTTLNGFDQCHRNTGANSFTLYNQVEGDVVNSAKKVKPSDVLFYNEGARREVVHFLPTDTKVGRTSPGQPTDLGTRFGVVGLIAPGEGLWQGLTTIITLPADRNSGTANPPRQTTFYARIGADATSRYSLTFPGTPGTYGSEGCALPAHEQLFECSAALWWPGNSEPRTTNLGAQDQDSLTRCNFTGATDTSGCRGYGGRVGMTYQVRDIDCYDYSTNAARGQGVHWGVLTGISCV